MFGVLIKGEEEGVDVWGFNEGKGRRRGWMLGFMSFSSFLGELM